MNRVAVRLQRAVAQLAQVDDKRVRSEVDFLSSKRVMQVSELDAEPRQNFSEEIKAFFSEFIGKKHLRLASATVAVINGIEDAEAPEQAAEKREKWYSEFGEMFAESKDKQLAGYGRQLAKALPRRRTVSREDVGTDR